MLKKNSQQVQYMEAKHVVIISTSLQTIAMKYTASHAIHIHISLLFVTGSNVYELYPVSKIQIYCFQFSSLVHAFEPQCIRAIYLLCTVIVSTQYCLTRPIMAMAVEEWWTTFGDVKPLFIERFAAVNRFTCICLLLLLLLLLLLFCNTHSANFGNTIFLLLASFDVNFVPPNFNSFSLRLIEFGAKVCNTIEYTTNTFIKLIHWEAFYYSDGKLHFNHDKFNWFFSFLVFIFQSIQVIE